MVTIQGIFDGQIIRPLEALPTGKRFRLQITFVEEIAEEEDLTTLNGYPIPEINGVDSVAEPRAEYTPEQLRFLEGMREALREVELHQQGKIEMKTAQEAFDEIWPE